jgi:hypothetical protein
MHFQFEVTPVTPIPATEHPTPTVEQTELLRQMLEVQKEQLKQLRASTAVHDMGGRWRAFLNRWQEEFPDLATACRKALPVIERAYGKLMADLTDTICQEGNDALDTDFALQEFLDRYGMRLAQLGTVLNLVGPLAEAGSQGESQGEAT